MPIALWTPPPLPRPPHEYQDDRDRKINGCCWDLLQVQRSLAGGALRLLFSTSASFDLTNELHWTGDDVVAFISALHRARYNDSEWCQFGNNSRHAHAADSYVMGFNRWTGEENQLTTPWVYFKFSVVETSGCVLVHSAHLERK
jgi:hypothetical protein